MEAIKAFFGGGGPKAPAFVPLPDRKPNVSAEQRAVPRDFNDIPERVLIHTTMGDITVSLFRQQTPRVRATFQIDSHNTTLTTILRPATTSPPSPHQASTTPSPATASFGAS